MKMLIGLHKPPEDQPTLRFARLVAGLLDADTTVTHPLNARKFLLAAEEGGFGIVALPWTDRPRLDKITRQVLANVTVSALVVKDRPTSIERLLVCSGGLPIAEPVIRTGARFAQAAGAKATLLHVSSAVPSMYTGLQAMEESLQELLSTDTPEAQHLRRGAQIFEKRNIQAVLELRHGIAVDEIMRATQLRDYDLILIGASTSAPRLNRVVVGDVTQRIVDRAPCSVLVTRNADLIDAEAS